jgi:UTP:GlnB (protein PII) uridylyltransferase
VAFRQAKARFEAETGIPESSGRAVTGLGALGRRDLVPASVLYLTST